MAEYYVELEDSRLDRELYYGFSGFSDSILWNLYMLISSSDSELHSIMASIILDILDDRKR